MDGDLSSITKPSSLSQTEGPFSVLTSHLSLCRLLGASCPLMTSHTLPAAVLMVIGTDVGFWGGPVSSDNHYPPPVTGPRLTDSLRDTFLMHSPIFVSMLSKTNAHAVFSFALFSLLVLELRWSGAKPPAGGRLHSSSFQQPCSSLVLFVAHSVVGLGDCRLSWPEPRAAASNNFNVNFPFILCVKLLLVWR
ncbi:unnamed protein product [Leuciscus chuanchicus]